MAAVRPGWYTVHPLRPAVRLPGRAGAAAADSQAQQIQNYIDGHPDMSRRYDVLRGHPRRAHQRFLRSKGEPYRGPRRPGGGAARRGGLRARVVHAVAPARGVLRAPDPARVAPPPARAVPGARGRRAHGRAAGRGAGRGARGAAGGRRRAARARAAAAARARLTRAGARAAARAGRRRAAAAARTAARAPEPTQAHLIIFTLDVSRVHERAGATRATGAAARPRRVPWTLFFRVLETFDVFTGVFCIRVAEA